MGRIFYKVQFIPSGHDIFRQYFSCRLFAQFSPERCTFQIEFKINFWHNSLRQESILNGENFGIHGSICARMKRLNNFRIFLIEKLSEDPKVKRCLEEYSHKRIFREICGGQISNRRGGANLWRNSREFLCLCRFENFLKGKFKLFFPYTTPVLELKKQKNESTAILTWMLNNITYFGNNDVRARFCISAK